MTVFILFQTDRWKSKASRIFCGIFDSREKAKDAAKYNRLQTHDAKIVIHEITLNLFSEL
jgi:hypothetical protein